MGKTGKDVCLCLIVVLWTAMVVVQFRRPGIISIIVAPSRVDRPDGYSVQVRLVQAYRSPQLDPDSVVRRILFPSSRAAPPPQQQQLGSAGDLATSTSDAMAAAEPSEVAAPRRYPAARFEPLSSVETSGSDPMSAGDSDALITARESVYRLVSKVKVNVQV